MKTHFKLMVCSAVSSIVVLAPLAPASAQETRFYGRAELGGQVTQDARLLSFFGEAIAPGSVVKFDPGVRFAFAGGYRVTDWFAGEFESGVMANNIRSITGASLVDDAFFSNVPLLLNARFECPPTKCPVTPYLGGGLGLSVSAIDADRIDIGGTTMEGNMSTAVFAYQAFAGIRYRLNDRMGLSLEYHYFATTDSSWEADITSGTFSRRMKMAGTQTHTATIAFDYRF